MLENQATSSKGFKSRFGFIMAAAGSAIGLGNIWNFSYKLGHYGGGAFLVTYLFMVLVIGIVAMVAEMFIGQRTQKNIVLSYKAVGKRWAFVGVLGIITAVCIASYYMVIGGWTIFMAGNSFNTSDTTSNVAGFVDFVNSGWLPILLAVIFIAIAIAVISLGVMKGIERFSKIVMPVLFVLLLIVMVKSLTLGEGVAEGVTFMFHVNFAELGFEGVLAAMGQAFYSLSLGMGIMVTYGSYTNKKVNLAKSAILISLLDTGIAIIAGLAIFPAVFAFDLEASGGIGLMFMTIPQVFNAMGGIGMLFSFIFFFLIFIAAITSMVSIMEVGTSYFADKLKMSKFKVATVVGVAVSLLGIIVSISVGGALAGESTIMIFDHDILTLLDDMSNKILMPVSVVLTCLALSFTFKTDNIIKELQEQGNLFKFHKVWIFLLKYVTPILVTVVLVAGMVEMVASRVAYGILVIVIGVILVCGSALVNHLIIKKEEKLDLGIDKK